MRSRREYEGDLSAKTQDADFARKVVLWRNFDILPDGVAEGLLCSTSRKNKQSFTGYDGQRTISLLSLFNGSKSPSCGIMHVYASQILCATQGHTLLQAYCLYAMPRDIHSAMCCCQHDCLNGLVAGK